MQKKQLSNTSVQFILPLSILELKLWCALNASLLAKYLLVLPVLIPICQITEGGRRRSSDGATPVASQPVHLLMRTDDEAEEEQPLPPYFIDFVSSLQSHPQVQMSISNIYTKRCEEISHSNS